MYKRIVIKHTSYKAAYVLNCTMENRIVWCQLFSKDLTCLMYESTVFILPHLSACLYHSVCSKNL